MQKIHLLARALIIKNNQILLAKGKGLKRTFLPGGHIKIRESAKESLNRELQEEIGIRVKVEKYLDAIEYSFGIGDNYQHEINHIFLVDLLDDKTIESKESHLEFLWVKVSELKKYNLEPKPLEKLIPKIIINEDSFFWGNTIKNEKIR